MFRKCFNHELSRIYGITQLFDDVFDHWISDVVGSSAPRALWRPSPSADVWGCLHLQACAWHLFGLRCIQMHNLDKHPLWQARGPRLRRDRGNVRTQKGRLLRGARARANTCSQSLRFLIQSRPSVCKFRATFVYTDWSRIWLKCPSKPKSQGCNFQCV